LTQKGISIKKIDIENRNIYWIPIKDKIVFIKLFDDNEEIDSIVQDSILLSELLNNDNFVGNFKGDIFSNNDNRNVVSDLRAILWDIYIIGIHWLINPTAKFKTEDISRIERNKVIARKIIIEDCSLKKISMEIQNLLDPTKQLNIIMNQNKSITEDEIFKVITSDRNDESLNYKGCKSLGDLIKYLEFIKEEIDEFKN
jgi:hypothetical protein